MLDFQCNMTGRVLTIAVVLCLMLTGCAQESRNASENHSRDNLPEVSETSRDSTEELIENDEHAKDSKSNPGIDSLTGSAVEVEAATSLATSIPWGVYGWNPVDGLPNAVWSGTLMIDESCVYLDVSHILDDSHHQDGYTIPEDEPLRSFLQLPQPLTQLNITTDELWVGEHGPMSSGAQVVVVGSGNPQQHLNSDLDSKTEFFEVNDLIASDEEGYVTEKYLRDEEGNHLRDEAGNYQTKGCYANVPFYVMSMQSSDSYSKRPELDLTRSQNVAGLTWDISTVFDSVGTSVILDIEPPCIYGVPLGHNGIPLENIDRVLLELPRPGVRFKDDTNLLWNNYLLWFKHHGPMRTGDVVTISGVDHPVADAFPLSPELQEAGCSAGGVLPSGSLTPGRW
ncbi:MAG: hypothetical protein OXD37_09210 [Acidimicrobiaceae bacterium]|nr:hypothetical protein [Acidimicrobiaceae bacterium]